MLPSTWGLRNLNLETACVSSATCLPFCLRRWVLFAFDVAFHLRLGDLNLDTARVSSVTPAFHFASDVTFDPRVGNLDLDIARVSQRPALQN
jgi:hypothetical protein